MKQLYYIFKVSLDKSFKETIRYRFNFIAEIVTLYIVFMAMFLGLKSFGVYMQVPSVVLDQTLEGFVAGYFVWTIILFSYSDIAYGITRDAMLGTLEQLSMAPIRLYKFLIIRAICNLLINLIASCLILIIIMFSTDYFLSINIIILIIGILGGIFSVFCIGLILGGLALIYKKIQSFLNIIQFVVLGLVIPGSSTSTLSYLIPFRPSILIIYKAMLNNYSLKDLSLQEILYMLLNTIIYLIIGIIIFNRCEKVAKKKGLLGQY
ncbi:MAG: ABC transporter permease [Bacilli bacterium]|nr:ABC transporter permease [Bacilli bacterium]